MQRNLGSIRRMLASALVAMAIAASAAPALAAGALSGVVNVNTASAEQLQLLPGVGEARARAILATRKRLGGFKSVDQLVEVKGIGAVALDRLRPFVVVQGKTTARIE